MCVCVSKLTHCPLGDLDAILKRRFSTLINQVNIGSGNGSVPSGNKPLPEQVLTLFIDAYIICGTRGDKPLVAMMACP